MTIKQHEAGELTFPSIKFNIHIWKEIVMQEKTISVIKTKFFRTYMQTRR